MDDVIIIGGGFSGLSAALQLGRALRRVTVLDTGLPRNRFAAHAHTILGHDHKPPRQILSEAREQIGRYKTVRFVDQAAVSAEGGIDDFRVALADETVLTARRIILAHGVRDEVPDIPGASECWGISYLHCPYCHGTEFAGRRLGGMVKPDAFAFAGPLYRDWSDDLTMFSNDQTLPPGTEAMLEGRGIRLVTDRVVKLEHDKGHLTAVVTERESVPIDALFAPPPTAFTTPIGEALGCKVDRAGHGPFFEVDEGQLTSVPGIYAAGDISRPMQSVPLAMTSGAGAAIFAHRSLLGLD
jgi:thioredoxin reductase